MNGLTNPSRKREGGLTPVGDHSLVAYASNESKINTLPSFDLDEEIKNALPTNWQPSAPSELRHEENLLVAIVISVETDFHVRWFQNQFLDKIRAVLPSRWKNLPFEFKITGLSESHRAELLAWEQPPAVKLPPVPRPPVQEELSFTPPDEIVYICGEENATLRDSVVNDLLKCDETGRGQHRMVNRLLLHGPQGVGKTTAATKLARRFGRVTRKAADKVGFRLVLNISAQKLSKDYAAAYQPNANPENKKDLDLQFARLMCLFVTGIEKFQDGKCKGTAAFLAEQISLVIERGGCVVLTTSTNEGEKGARQISDSFGEELKQAISRFTFFPVNPASIETRKEILGKLKCNDKTLTADQIDQLAQGSEPCGQMIASGKQWLLGIAPTPSDQLTLTEKVAAKEAVIQIARLFNLSLEAIRGKGRSKNVAFARQVVAYILREDYDLGYSQVGNLINKDHTTAMYAVTKVSGLLADPGFQDTLESVRACLTKK